MTEIDDVVRRHGYHRLRVKAVVEETDDTRSFVLDVPGELREAFRYQPGQFCSFRVHIDDDEHARCYSMSSAPDTDDDLTVTVKRVPGGLVSNWLNDHVSAGDLLEVTRPAGTFCVRPADRPVIAFCGGSGVTPVMSIAKSVLAASPRPVHLLYANRDRGSVIFDEPLAALAASVSGPPRRCATTSTPTAASSTRRPSPSSSPVASTPTSTSAGRDRSWTWSRRRSLGAGGRPRRHLHRALRDAARRNRRRTTGDGR